MDEKQSKTVNEIQLSDIIRELHWTHDLEIITGSLPNMSNCQKNHVQYTAIASSLERKPWIKKTAPDQSTGTASHWVTNPTNQCD